MENSQAIKDLVKEKYGEIAHQSKEENAASCCGVGDCNVDYSIFSEDYSKQEGYLESADLALGCGIPVDHAGIKAGDVVVDLGSGAGNDVFVARAMTGETGEVIGIDMTEAMIEKANANKAKLGFSNVKFRLGDIENIPMSANKADVVLSNCVLNLVPDKEKAFAEIHRILKPGGHFTISDVVIRGSLPKGMQDAAELYAGCVAGAMNMNDYLAVIHAQEFQCVSVKAEKRIFVPDETLLKFLSQEELEAFKASDTGIFSITVNGIKGECGSQSGCC